MEAHPERIGAARICLDESDRRFREDERDVALEPVPQPDTLTRDLVADWTEIDQNGVAVELDREAPQLIRPLVEGAAGGEVEASVVPVARENPVADGAAMKRKPHVRAAIVDCMHIVTVREEAQHVPIEVDDEPSGRA